MTDLSRKKCGPCSKWTPPLKGEKLEQVFSELADGWKIVDEHHLEKEYLFKDFRQALDFTNEIGLIAEEEGHHPDIHLSWGKVKVVYGPTKSMAFLKAILFWQQNAMKAFLFTLRKKIRFS